MRRFAAGLLMAAVLAPAPAVAQRVYSDDALASELLGKTIVNRRAERLGEIADIVIDLERGRASFVLIESGGFLGLFGSVRAIPFEWLATGKRASVMVLNVSRAELEAAGREPPPGSRASDILGAPVHEADGRGTGELRDLVVSLEDGKLRHAVVVFADSRRQVTMDPRLLVSAVGAPYGPAVARRRP